MKNYTGGELKRPYDIYTTTKGVLLSTLETLIVNMANMIQYIAIELQIRVCNRIVKIYGCLKIMLIFDLHGYDNYMIKTLTLGFYYDFGSYCISLYYALVDNFYCVQKHSGSLVCHLCHLLSPRGIGVGIPARERIQGCKTKNCNVTIQIWMIINMALWQWVDMFPLDQGL